MVRPIEPGSGGGLALVGAALRPVGAAGSVGADTGPVITGTSEGVGSKSASRAGGRVLCAEVRCERRE